MHRTLCMMALILAPGSVSAEQYLSFGRAVSISGGSTIDACIERFCLPGLVDHELSGSGYEVGLGQRWHIGRASVGLGLSYLDGEFNGSQRYGNDRFGASFDTSIERVVSIRFELGYAVTDELSIFGFGGPAALQGSVGAAAYVGPHRVEEASDGWLLGQRYGIGARYDLDGPWSLVGEFSRVRAKGKYERTERVYGRDIDGHLNGVFELELFTIKLERTF